jgi:hypothetical protein
MQLEPSQAACCIPKRRSSCLANARREFDRQQNRLLSSALPLLATLLLVELSACRLGRFDSDSVMPGDYGPMQSGSGGAPTSKPSGGAAEGGNAGTNPTPTPTGSSTLPTTGASGVNGGSGITGTAGIASVAGTGSAAGAAGAKNPGTPMAGSSGESSPMAGTGSTTPAGPCDLSGRWLSTVHTVTDALGQQQIAHSYVYYEITQQGDAFTISKGMDCGDDAVGAGSFAATVDFKAAWASVASKAGYTGRTGTSAVASGGCQVEFAKWYTVRGATVPYYTDPSKPMPTVDDKAMGDQPGWEDWDGDGNPGITGMVSGAVTGKIFTAPRVWSHISGSVSDANSTFKLPVMWDQEPNVMSYDGSPLLLSEAARAADATLHFAEFARLGADQAVGDDHAICTSLVALAPTLTPVAAAGM